MKEILACAVFLIIAGFLVLVPDSPRMNVVGGLMLISGLFAMVITAFRDRRVRAR